jgi:type I restriction enzyme S subunit
MTKGWQRKRVGDFCEVIAGQSPEGKFYNSDGKGMPFYQGKKDFGDKFIEEPTTWTTQITKIARKGDILMSVRAPVGPVNFAADEICIGRGLAAIRSGAELNRDFLFYQLLHLQAEIAGREGAVFASINKSEIEALPIAFAPLPEQRRIVGILDETFDGIATANANAEKNLQNARALFESHLQSVFTQRGPGWEETTIGQIIRFIDYRGKTPAKTASGLRLITAKNVKMGYLQETPREFVAPKSYGAWMTRGIPRRGNVLFTTEAPLANVAQLDTDEKVVFAQRIIIMQPDAANSTAHS